MLTMSALPRLLNCPSSAVLARAENASVWADAGHLDHEELAELADPEHEFAHLLGAGARSEVKVAYDVIARTGRIIGEGGGRDYGVLGPFEIAGSIDALWVEGDTVVVLDWKTGYADVDPASRNWQLWGYALAACAALGKRQARVMVVYTKTARVDSYEIDAFELADFAARVAALHARVPELRAAKLRGEQLDTREGSWCKHCPSKHVCPSKNALLVQVAKVGLASEVVRKFAGPDGPTPEALTAFESVASEGLAVISDVEMTPERARAAYEHLMRIEQLVKDAKKRLDSYVTENGPIDLGNGRAYGRYAREGDRKIDAAKAMAAIREVVGEKAKEFESVAFERKTSQAAIERACKAVAGPRGLKAKVLKRIEELGGISRPIEYPIGEAPVEKFGEAPPTFDVDAVNQLLREAS